MMEKVKLHPLTLFFLSIIASFSVFIGTNFIYYVILVMAFVILLIHKPAGLIQFVPWTLFLFLFVNIWHRIAMMRFYLGAIYTILFVILRLIPIFIMGYVMSGFSASELMSAYRKIRLPEKICIGIAVFFRYLPDFRQRMREIKQGAKLRGLRPSIRRPVHSMALFLVPMIYKGLHLSDTVAASTITKGIEYEGKKTNYGERPFGISDVLALPCIALMIGDMIWKNL
ncbi:MAG: energy-coupling factor transporter transmembrane component T [Eubacteriales bacterium]|nr:energy-coupling factor transporter transmembrane component T [Eubacteriales bacterium]